MVDTAVHDATDATPNSLYNAPTTLISPSSCAPFGFVSASRAQGIFGDGEGIFRGVTRRILGSTWCESWDLFAIFGDTKAFIAGRKICDSIIDTSSSSNEGLMPFIFSKWSLQASNRWNRSATDFKMEPKCEDRKHWLDLFLMTEYRRYHVT